MKKVELQTVLIVILEKSELIHIIVSQFTFHNVIILIKSVCWYK